MSLPRFYHSREMKRREERRRGGGRAEEWRVWKGQKKRGGGDSQARVRGENIEEVTEKRRVKSCRGQMTGGVGAGGHTEEEEKSEG